MTAAKLVSVVVVATADDGSVSTWHFAGDEIDRPVIVETRELHRGRLFETLGAFGSEPDDWETTLSVSAREASRVIFSGAR